MRRSQLAYGVGEPRHDRRLRHLNATQADEFLDIFHQAECAKADWRRIRSSIERKSQILHGLCSCSSML